MEDEKYYQEEEREQEDQETLPQSHESELTFTETAYETLPKIATATVQGVLGPSLLQKLLWSRRNLLSNEFVGHSCSVQL